MAATARWPVETPRWRARATNETIMSTMMGAMDFAPTGDVDVDFVRGMIPHHEAAVAMAELVLEKGTDPEVRALAEAVVAAQAAEIAWMQAWLEARGQ